MTIVKRSKTGLGLFAAADISKGERIIQYTGKLISNEEADQHRGRYLFTLDSEQTIDGGSRENLARYINHSCRPNADSDVIDKEIWIVARRKIKAFEEVTIKYGKSYFNQVIKPKGCKCVKCSPEVKT
ncbi:MAG TPA: SET domain-containing protein-lysine N-methyltransferase [Pyrinomonadaceae bacterium]|nr:SET domain-containing protein-lysine N-methyltransferase [Pyrinomonadaceae bacterium]